MGSTSSKLSSSTPHVWKGPSQPGVSQNLVESLETSNEVRPTNTPPRVGHLTENFPSQTDVSRLQSLELQIQERVGVELKRLRAQEAEALREAQQKLSAEPATTADQQGESEPLRQQQQQLSGPSRHEVSKAIDDLRTKLEERRQVRQLPDGVEKARNEVVRCLHENDRRPLDCWREVEAFKDEVRRLEKGWVDKVVS
ncbi:DUF1690-domain-containing protein [Parathielavia appendiculata]|uniref:DUF1690-domain-containing protein n=1 Tax=Parathielavia appendiculata TaxID=2587402 RepID=A0AAN6U252_9PEZI|nr:DUF1690-domain-containing protein [Parathielavia appendiculata]